MLDRSFIARALTPAFAAGAVVFAAALFGLVTVPGLSPGLDKVGLALGLKAELREHLPEVSSDSVSSAPNTIESALENSAESAVVTGADPAQPSNAAGPEAWDPWSSNTEGPPGPTTPGAVTTVGPDAVGLAGDSPREQGTQSTQDTQGTQSEQSEQSKPKPGAPATLTGKAAETVAENVVTEPPPPLLLSDVHLVAVSPFAATVTWRTSLPTLTQVAYGLDGAVLWSEASTGQEHRATLGGLTMGEHYQFQVVAWDNHGRREQSGLGTFTTPRSSDVTMSIHGDTIHLNGQPFFPRMIMDGCDRLNEILKEGINLFLLSNCSDHAALRGRAFAVRPYNSSVRGGHIIGRALPDEWDTSMPNTLTAAQLEGEIPKTPEPEFLTLTNHFYSRAEPLPQGKGMYPAMMSRGDVIGWDLYPLQIWCRDNAFQDVFYGQRELNTLSGGKPTYQWIEVTEMERDCGKAPTNRVTAQTVRAETWLAVAGGADGVAYFPYYWNAGVGGALAEINRKISALAPALLSPDATAEGEGPVLVGARRMNGALYVIAVNTDAHTARSSRIQVPSLNGRPLTVYGEGRQLRPDGDSFSDNFEPLAVHIYISEPA